MSDGSQRKITEKDLLEAFARVIRDDHPNPQREQCPNPSVLQQIAAAPANEMLINESTLRHISHCWPCLNDLKKLRESRQS